MRNPISNITIEENNPYTLISNSPETTLAGITFPEEIDNVRKDSQGFNDKLKKWCNDFKKDLWCKSLNEHHGIFLFKLWQTFAFIANNFVVNTFSILGECKEIKCTEKTSPILLYASICIFGLFTFNANLLSKTVDVGNDIEGLNLDGNWPSCLPRFLSFFIKSLWSGPETTFFLNLRQKIVENTYQGERCEYVVCLDQTDVDPIAPTIQKAFQLLMVDYFLTTGKNLYFIERSALKTTQEDAAKKSHTRLVIVANFDPTNEERSIFNNVFIRFHENGWITRLALAFKNFQISDFISDLTKASLSLIVWFTAQGFPSTVVLLTGVVTLSNIEDRIMGAESKSRWVHLLYFFINAWICTTGRVAINLKIKSSITSLEIHKLCEKLWHWQPLMANCNFKMAFLTTIISILSTIPYVICTAWFFTASGIKKTLDEVNFITGSELSLSPLMSDFITYSAVISSIPMGIVTNSYPCYRLLTKVFIHKKHLLAANEATNSYHISWILFNISCCGDSLAFAINALFNVISTWKIIEGLHADFHETSDEYPYMKYLIGGLIALGTFIQATFFCIDRAAPKFEHAIDFCREVPQYFFGEFKFRCANLFQNFFPRRSSESNSIIAPLLAGNNMLYQNQIHSHPTTKVSAPKDLFELDGVSTTYHS